MSVARRTAESARTVPIRSTVPREGLSRKIPKSIWKDYERSRKMVGERGEGGDRVEYKGDCVRR